jgi:hypothetical protein
VSTTDLKVSVTASIGTQERHWMPPPQFWPTIVGAFCRFSRNLQDPVIDVPLSPIAATSRSEGHHHG